MYSLRFTSALTIAHEFHAHQVRKGGNIPYIAHLMSVASLVMEHGGNEDEAIAALLHDAIEDQGHRFQGGADTLRRYIQERFGDHVLFIVEECTDADTQPKPPWRQRKEAYIAGILHKSPSALLVSCADKLHNARAILQDYEVLGEELWQRFAGKKEGTLWYYQSLVTAFQQNPQSPQTLVRQLTQTVQTLTQLTQ